MYLIRHSKLSKGYVFLRENKAGNVTEIESKDATFMEKYFPTRGEISKDLPLYEMEDPIDNVTNTEDNQIGDTPHPSGSSTSHMDLQEPHLRRSVRQSIACCH